MIDWIAHNLAPIMFISVMAMLLLGYPVALTLAAGGLVFFVIGVGLSELAPNQIDLFWSLLGTSPNRVYGVMSNETLLAIPFFTFMGLILERSRMAEDLLDTISQLFGPARGGLAYAVVLVGALLGATTGVVAASVIAMGLISLPIMLRSNYNQSLAAGTIAASGTLAQIIPPALVIIVLADQLGVSVGDMYVGAVYPALAIVATYCAYIFVLSIVAPKSMPALPPEARTLGSGITSLLFALLAAIGLFYFTYHFVFVGLRYEDRLVAAAATAVGLVYMFALANKQFSLNVLSRLAQEVVIALIPPLTLIFLVLGTIFLGIATPTEGGAMGAVGALLLAFAKKRLSVGLVRSALEATAKLSAFVMFILIGARVFGLTFYGIGGDAWIAELLGNLPGGQTGFLILITIVVFVLGCFLDFFEIAFILVPLVGPVAHALGIDLIWFGILISINLQTSFLTPPFGFSLFFLRSVAPAKNWSDKSSGRTLPGLPTIAIYKGVVPFIVIHIAIMAAVILFPSMVTHYKGSSTPMEPNAIQLQLPPLGDSFSLPPLNIQPN